MTNISVSLHLYCQKQKMQKIFEENIAPKYSGWTT